MILPSLQLWRGFLLQATLIPILVTPMWRMSREKVCLAKAILMIQQPMTRPLPKLLAVVVLTPPRFHPKLLLSLFFQGNRLISSPSIDLHIVVLVVAVDPKITTTTLKTNNPDNLKLKDTKLDDPLEKIHSAPRKNNQAIKDQQEPMPPCRPNSIQWPVSLVNCFLLLTPN